MCCARHAARVVTAHASSTVGDGVFQARSGYGLINIQSRLAWKRATLSQEFIGGGTCLHLRVSKFSTCPAFLPGPGAHRRSLDLGADVWKIEPPAGGDDTELDAAEPNGESTYFMCCNRSRRSVTMDRKHPERKSWCASWPTKRTPPRRRRTPRAEAEGNASKAPAGHRTGKACHRRWNAYGKPQRKGGKFTAVHLGTVRPSYTCILIAVR